jgi:hypothetical protein
LMHTCFILQYVFIILYMFRTLYAHHQEVELYDAAFAIVTLSRWPSGAQVEREL